MAYEPRRNRAATDTPRFVAVGVIVLCLTLSGCGGGGGPTGAKAAACGNALDRYSTDLVASDADGKGPTLAPTELRSHQVAVVKNCTEDQFVTLIKGYGYDYTKGIDAITSHDPRQTYRTFKTKSFRRARATSRSG